MTQPFGYFDFVRRGNRPYVAQKPALHYQTDLIKKSGRNLDENRATVF